jgi:hypothetical protein
MDWVYPSHVSCPVARTLTRDQDDQNPVKDIKCEAGDIGYFTDIIRFGDEAGAIKPGHVPKTSVCNVNTRCFDNHDDWAEDLEEEQLQERDNYLKDTSLVPEKIELYAGYFFLEMQLFAGVALDAVNEKDEGQTLATFQYRGVTNVRLAKATIPYLTKIAQNGDPYGVRLYGRFEQVTEGSTQLRVVAAACPAVDFDDKENENTFDSNKYCIGFVHTYHPHSRFVEMEILPTRVTSVPGSDHITGYLPNDEDKQNEPKHAYFVMAGAMVDDGSAKNPQGPKFVHARPAEQSTANAASALVGALEIRENKQNLAVPLGSFVATAQSHKHRPRTLGAKVTKQADDVAVVDIEKGTAAHFLLQGGRSSKSRKRKSMAGAVAMDNDPGTLLTIANGMVDADTSGESVDLVYNSKYFSVEAVKRFKGMLHSNYETGEVSSVSEFQDVLLGDGVSPGPARPRADDAAGAAPAAEAAASATK